MTLAVVGGFTRVMTGTQVLSALPFAILLLPSNLGGFPLNGPAWSVFFELLVNVIYGFFINTLTDRNLKIIVLILALALIVVVTAHPKHHLDVGFSFPYYAEIFRTTYSFFLGVLLHRRFCISGEPALPKFIKPIMPWLMIGIITAVLTAHPYPSIRPYFVTLSILLLFPILIFISLWFQPSGFGARICRMLGTASYGIYATHAPLSIFISGMMAEIFGKHVRDFAPWSGFLFLMFLIPSVYSSIIFTTIHSDAYYCGEPKYQKS